MAGSKHVALMVLITLLLAGCGAPVRPSAGGVPRGDSTTAAGVHSSPADEPVDGGTLYLSMFSAPRGVFNPILMEDGYDANIVGLVFAGLLTRDERLELVCDLCESFTVSPEIGRAHV